MAVSVTTHQWLDRARDLAPLVQEWRDAGERDRQLPQPVFEAMKRAGLFRLLVPEQFGGAAVPPEVAMAVIEEVSRQDGAAGWNLMIGISCGRFAGSLPESGAQEIFGARPDSPIAGGFAPNGRAVPVDGGYRLSGRWGFASGCQHVDWLLAGASTAAEGQEAPSRPLRRFFIVPAQECEILDTWYTSGLRGTGSHDFEISDTFVPEHRSMLVVQSGMSCPGQVSFQAFLAEGGLLMSSVALGIAHDAIESFTTLATTKTPRSSTMTLAAQHTTHERVGRAQALMQSARAFVGDVAREVGAVQAGEAIGDELFTRARLASAFAAQSAADAVDVMYSAAGGSSVYATSRIERCFRDVHMVTQHVTVAPSNIEMAGQYYLGLGLQLRR